MELPELLKNLSILQGEWKELIGQFVVSKESGNYQLHAPSSGGKEGWTFQSLIHPENHFPGLPAGLSDEQAQWLMQEHAGAFILVEWRRTSTLLPSSRPTVSQTSSFQEGVIVATPGGAVLVNLMASGTAQLRGRQWSEVSKSGFGMRYVPVKGEQVSAEELFLQEDSDGWGKGVNSRIIPMDHQPDLHSLLEELSSAQVNVHPSQSLLEIENLRHRLDSLIDEELARRRGASASKPGDKIRKPEK